MAYIPGGSNSVTLAQSKALQDKRKAEAAAAKKKAEQAAQRQGANLTGQATSGSLGTPSTPAAVKAVADAVAAATNTKPTPTFTPPKSNNSSNRNRVSPAVKPPVSVTGGSMVRGGNVPTRNQEPPKYQYGSGKPIANPKSGGGSTVSGEYGGSGHKSGVNKEFGRDSNRSTYEQRMASQRLAMNVRENPTTAVGEWAQLFDPLAGLARVGSGGERFNAIDDNSAENYGAVDAVFDVMGAVPLVGAGLKVGKVAKTLGKVGDVVLSSGVPISSKVDFHAADKAIKVLENSKSSKEFKATIKSLIGEADTALEAMSHNPELVAKNQAMKSMLEGLNKVAYKQKDAAISEIKDGLSKLAKDPNRVASKGKGTLKDTTNLVKVGNFSTRLSPKSDFQLLFDTGELLQGVRTNADFANIVKVQKGKVDDALKNALKGLDAAKNSKNAKAIETQNAVVLGIIKTGDVLDELAEMSVGKGKKAAYELVTGLSDKLNVGGKVADNAVNAVNVSGKAAKGADEVVNVADDVTDDLINSMGSDTVLNPAGIGRALGEGTGKGASKNLVDEATKAVKNAADEIGGNAAKETGKPIGDTLGKGADDVEELREKAKAARKAYRDAAKGGRPPIGISKKGLIGGGAVVLGSGIMIGEAGKRVGATTNGEEGQELLYDAIMGPATTDTSSDYIPGSRNTLGGGTTAPSGPTTPPISGVAPPPNTPFGEIPFYQNPDGTITGRNSNGDTVFQTSLYSVDENGNYVETPGYIINGQTYFDAEGTQRLPEGGQYAVVNPYYTGEEGSTQPMLWGMDSLEGGNPTLTAEELENYFLDNIQDEEDMTTFDSFMEPYLPYLESEYARIDAEVEVQIRALREEAAARGLYNADAMLMMEQEIRAAGEAQKTSLYASVLAEVQAKYMDYLTRKEERAQELYMYETSLDFNRERADIEDQQWWADYQQNSQKGAGSGKGSSVVTPPLPSEAYNILSYYQDLFESNPSQQAFTSRMYGLADALRGAGHDDATVRKILKEFSSRITSMYPDISPYK